MGFSTGKIEKPIARSGRKRICWARRTSSAYTSSRPAFDLSHSSYDGRQTFSPVDIVGVAGTTLERIEFGAPTAFTVHQNEFAWFVADEWRLGPRLSINLGLRFDRDSVTDSTHAQPRAGLTLALTSDRKTLLKAGGGTLLRSGAFERAGFPIFSAS